MKGFFFFFWFFYFVNWCGSKPLKLEEIAVLAYDVLSLGNDFINSLISDDNFISVQGMINKLQKMMEELHNKLDYITQQLEDLLFLVSELPYKIAISQHIDKIRSCKTDFNNLFGNPNNTAALSIFKKCHNIVVSVRAIGRYLSGKASIGPYPFFEIYYEKDGYYRGQAIETMFRYLYTNFIDGCILIVAAERMVYNQTSALYRDECWKTFGEINSYMTKFYRKCMTKSCSSFLSQVSKLFQTYQIKNTSAALKILENNFPWFQFIVVESSTTASIVENNGTFVLNSKTFPIHGKIFHVFWTDFSVSFVKNMTTENQQFVNVTILICDFEDSSYGMNFSKRFYLEEKLISFVGYTSDPTMDTCEYSQELGGSPSLSSIRKLPNNFMIFIFACATLILR